MTNNQNIIKQKQAELNRINKQIQLEKNRQRKKRTHRLIQKGALLEKYFNLQNISVEKTEDYLKYLKEKTKGS